MINFFKIIPFILLLFLTSCEKEKPTEKVDIYFGNASALLNGSPWNTKVRTSWAYGTVDIINVSIELFSGNNLRNTLHVMKLPFIESLSTMHLSQNFQSCPGACTSFSTSLDDGDVAGDFYILAENSVLESWITIDSINLETLELWGRFQGVFLRDDKQPKLDVLSDTIYFENGIFNSKVIE